jgi:hypothetical protein
VRSLTDQEDAFAHHREAIAKLRADAQEHEEKAADLRSRAEQATMVLNILVRKHREKERIA